jgi:hypothetical protein
MHSVGVTTTLLARYGHVSTKTLGFIGTHPFLDEYQEAAHRKYMHISI